VSWSRAAAAALVLLAIAGCAREPLRPAADNAAVMGHLFRKELGQLNSPHISIIRGKGLLNGIVIQHADKEAAWNLCLELKENGLLAKPTHGDKIRFAPPLLISKDEILECISILEKSLVKLDKPKRFTT
jgi:ornithine--oxo-acid transaminase